MGGTVVFKGQAELSAALMRKTNLDAVKTVVRANGTRLQQWTKLRAPIDTGRRCSDPSTCRLRTAACLLWCSHIPNMQPTLNLAHEKWRRSHTSNRRSIPLKPSSSQTCRN